MFVLFLACLGRMCEDPGPFDDCDHPALPPIRRNQQRTIDDILEETGICLEKLAFAIKDEFDVAHHPPSYIGMDGLINYPPKNVYLTSTNGATTGPCTDINNRCSVAYYFGPNGPTIEDYTIVHFDPNPSVPYPSITCKITSFIWVTGHGAVINDSVKFLVDIRDKTLEEDQRRLINILDFTFQFCTCPPISILVNDVDLACNSRIGFDVRNVIFRYAYTRVIEVLVGNESLPYCPDDACACNQIDVRVYNTSFYACTRIAEEDSLKGGLVYIQNMNRLLPVTAIFHTCYFAMNNFVSGEGGIGPLEGGCIAMINLYAISICKTTFNDNRIYAVNASVNGGCVYIDNDPECYLNRYSVIAFTNFNRNIVNGTMKSDNVVTGATVYARGQFALFYLNTQVFGTYITSFTEMLGGDLAALETVNLNIYGTEFRQQVFEPGAFLTCATVPDVLHGGSVYFEPLERFNSAAVKSVFSFVWSIINNDNWESYVPNPPNATICNSNSTYEGAGIYFSSEVENRNVYLRFINSTFVRLAANTGGALRLLAHGIDTLGCSVRSFEIVNHFVNFTNVFFEACVATERGGSLAAASIATSQGAGPVQQLVFKMSFNNITQHNNWYPSSSFSIADSKVTMANFAAFANEAGHGVIDIWQSTLSINFNFNITFTKLNYLGTVPFAVGGIRIGGALSALVFLQNATVVINTTGSANAELGWGLLLRNSAATIPVMNYAGDDAIIINRVDAKTNCMLLAMTINNQCTTCGCAVNGLIPCSNDPNVRCINYCLCPLGGDYYCGVCFSPTAMPPTLPFTPTASTPPATPTAPPATPTATPVASPSPVQTATPVETPTPQMTPTPLETATPYATQTPIETATPYASPTPGATSSTPHPTQTPAMTPTPICTATPVRTPTPPCTPTPLCTPTPVCTATPQTPDCTPTPVCTPTPLCTASPVPTKSYSPAPSRTPGPTKNKGFALKLLIEYMVSNKFNECRNSTSFDNHEVIYILVNSTMTGGRLKFMQLSIVITDKLGKTSEHIIPVANVTIHYWSDSPDSFGLSVGVASLPSSVGSTIHVKIEAVYEMMSGMNDDEVLAVTGDGVIPFAVTGGAQTAAPDTTVDISNTQEPQNNNNSNGAGFALFGVHRILLAVGVIAAAALPAIMN